MTVFNIHSLTRIILLCLLLPIIYVRGVVIEPLQFSNQMLFPYRQLESKEIIDQLQNNEEEEMKQREKR